MKCKRGMLEWAAGVSSRGVVSFPAEDGAARGRIDYQLHYKHPGGHSRGEVARKIVFLTSRRHMPMYSSGARVWPMSTSLPVGEIIFILRTLRSMMLLGSSNSSTYQAKRKKYSRESEREAGGVRF